MFKKERFISLFIVILMIVASAIIVNKSIFGHNIEKLIVAESESIAESDTISLVEDGTIIIHTSGMPGTIDGYAGAVPLDIYLKDGKITEVKALENDETPPFFERASKILSEWVGKTPEEAAILRVDGVSGATYSSTAIINNVNVGLAYYKGSEVNKSTSVPLKIWIAFAVTLIACIVPLIVKNRIYHIVQMVANIVVLGFWTGQFLDYSLILKYSAHGFTWPGVMIAAAMMIAAFIYPLFGKPQHYCTHICPLGSAQQLMAQICGFKLQISPKMVKALDWFRRILWAVLMLFLWADCFTDWMDLELFQAFQYESASWGIIIAACIFILLSSIVSRPYCRFVCPTGSLFKRAENIG